MILLEKRKISAENDTPHNTKKLCNPLSSNIQSNIIDSSTSPLSPSSTKHNSSMKSHNQQQKLSSLGSTPLQNKNNKNTCPVPKLKKLKSPKRVKPPTGKFVYDGTTCCALLHKFYIFIS